MSRFLSGLVVASMLAGSVLLASQFSGCATQQMAIPFITEKVATVDGKVITKAQYDRLQNQFKQMFGLDAAQAGAAGQGAAPQNDMIKAMLNQMALNKLIVTTLIQSEAQKAGITVTDADIKSFKDKQMATPEKRKQFEAFLSQNKLAEADFDQNLKEQLLIDKFIETTGGDKVKVSEAAAKNYYQQHPAEFDLPERIGASHILLKAIAPAIAQELKQKTPKITEAEVQAEVAKVRVSQKTKANDVFKQVQQHPDQFAELAKKYSEDTASAAHGGDLGDLVPQSTEPTFWKALQSGKPEALYPQVVETVFGYHIIFVKDKKSAHHLSFDEIKADLIQQMAGQKKQAFLQQWVAEKKNTAQIVIEPKYKPQPQELPPAGPAAGSPPGAVGQQTPSGGAATPGGVMPPVGQAILVKPGDKKS